MSTITKEKATHLDLILRYFIEGSTDICSVNTIKKDILPNYPIEYCKSLVVILEYQDPKLIKDIEYIDNDDFVFFVTDYINTFLENGGFTKKYNTEADIQSIAQERNTLELEKLRYDVKNSKFNFKTNPLSFIFLLISGVLIIIQIIQAILKWNNHNID